MTPVPGERLVVGRVGRAHGLRGEVAVTFTSNRPERAEPGSVLFVGDRELVIDASRPHQGRMLVQFVGIDDEVGAEGNRITGARALAVTEYVTRNLADNPDAIEVDVEERGDEVALMVRANPSDMGRLIGKRGRVIQALRQLVRAAGTADGVKANVDIVE